MAAFGSLPVPLDLHKIALILFLAALAPVLVSCGRRGPLELPPGAPAACAAPAPPAPGSSPAGANGGSQGQPGGYTAGEPPPSAAPCTKQTSPRPFFLDPLL